MNFKRLRSVIMRIVSHRGPAPRHEDAPVASAKGFEGFLQAQEQRQRLRLNQEPFAPLILAVELAYEAGRLGLPKSSDLRIPQLFLLCHRSFLLAAAMIIQGHPADSGSVTRRAIEMARLAFALAYDSENVRRWGREEERLERWIARQEDRRPPRLQIEWKLPRPHSLLDTLGRWEGMLSDACVHFTPEFLFQYPFSFRRNEALLSYFVENEEELRRMMRFCAATHLQILQLFDEAFAGQLKRQEAWCEAMKNLIAVGRRLCPPDAETQ